jgi:hypothetical protein
MNIQNLIAAGRLKDALTELAKIHPDAILLKGQYTSAERENNLGLLDGGDWRRVVARITQSALELTRQYGGPVYVDNSVHVTAITINMTGTDFAATVASIHMDALIAQCNAAFKGTELMSDYLDIVHSYQKQEAMGTAISPGFIKEIKGKIVDMYTRFIETKTSKKDQRQYEDLNEAHEILKKKQLDKDEVLEACDLLLIFLTDNPGYMGRTLIADVRREIDTDIMQTLAKRRPERYQEKIDEFHRELTAMINRILSSLEK